MAKWQKLNMHIRIFVRLIFAA